MNTRPIVIDSPDEIQRRTYDTKGGARRVAESGLGLPSAGVNLDAAGGTVCNRRCAMLLYNADSAIHWIAFYPEAGSAAVAPSGPATGLPILPGATVVYNSGENEVAITDSPTVWAWFQLGTPGRSFVPPATPPSVTPYGLPTP
jgi:hypothetical protein